MAYNINRNMKVDKFPLHRPTLEEVRCILEEALRQNFYDASVTVVTCPDLTAPPFGLVAPGLGGTPRLADVGGVPNLTPVPQTNKVYSLNNVLKLVQMEDGMIIGPGAGNSHFVGVNSEMMANLHVGQVDSSIKNCSYVSKVDTENGNCCHLDKYRTMEFGLMANLFISQGKTGEVLEVKASKRKGEENLISCLRNSLKHHFQEKGKFVGMGGVFNIVSGKAKFHVMPAFPETPFSCDADVDKWLHFYDFHAPLTVVSAFISDDIPGQGLRVEHSHGWSPHGEGGHYHYDVTPDEVAYHGYFNVADFMYRIDKPE